MRFISIFIVFIVNSLTAGEIVTTSDFGRIEEESLKLEENCLVLFDVDATLIVPDDVILKPKGKALFKQLIANCTDRDLFRDIRMKASHSLVDPKSVDLIQKLSQQKIPVIAFTAAPAKIRGQAQPGDWRVEELKRHGFDFSQSLPSCHYLELPKSQELNHIPLFKHGVLFSSLHSKGEILIEFLHRLNLKPEKIIFVDDEFEFVRSVVSCLDKEGIPCLGFHYTAANDTPCELYPEQARFQVDHFINHEIWLSDNECRTEVNKCIR